ncbi:transporter substrate-binding domain-containing protein [Microbulbifer sp. SAOS-129_SWC]|uniref:transporter substrate-binding domain-containing protein n=1 Tax=Microbulbifer sp. SAOS-129_SWC TaxID=3145235 RepID=UPI003217CF66
MRGVWVRVFALIVIATLIFSGGCEQRQPPPASDQPSADSTPAGKTEASEAQTARSQTTAPKTAEPNTVEPETNAAPRSDQSQAAGPATAAPGAGGFPGGSKWVPEILGEYPIDAYPNYTERGDLKAIERHGKLRILVDISTTESLHRAATQQDIELDQLKRFARQLGLEPVVLYVDSFDQLIPLLNAGQGDIIANDLTITDARKQQVDFSVPTVRTRLVLVSQQGVPTVGKGDKLEGKTLTVTRGTTYATRAREFVRQHPGVKLVVTDRNYVDIAIDVASGKTDFTIIDGFILDLVLQFRNDLKKNVEFPEEQVLAWAIRKSSPQLLDAVNSKIRHIKLTRSSGRFTGDLAAIKKRGVLRAVTRNNASSYFMWKGRILGYEYELLEAFAKDLGVRLEMKVVPEHDNFIDMLKNGQADIAANLLTPTSRRKQQGVRFSARTHKAKVVVVSRPGKEVKKLSDLAGRTVYVRKSSSHYDLVQRIRQQVPGLRVQLVPESMDIQQIFDKIASGDYDITFADDLTANMERSWRTDIAPSLDLHDDHPHAWMLRQNNPELLSAVNHFLKKPKTLVKRRVLYKKYFNSPKPPRPEITKLSKAGKISPFDDLVRHYADKHNFDWRLVVAQMFQESTFNPKAKSWVGARGLMQVMPDTGKQVGEKNLFDPETSVRAGMKYLDWLHRKFEDKRISSENMMWFTLASYNAGLGHVYDAQKLAEEKGWDPRVWFGNVDKAMLLLSEKKYYSKARYGYARGREPYDYVRKIEARFRTYVALLEAYQRQQQTTLRPPLAPSALSFSLRSASTATCRWPTLPPRRQLDCMELPISRPGLRHDRRRETPAVSDAAVDPVDYRRL